MKLELMMLLAAPGLKENRPKSLWFSAVMLAICLGLWIWSRDLPTTIGNQVLPIPDVYAGDEAIFDLPVERNFSQKCSVTVSREIVDSSGAKRTLFVNQEIDDESLRARDLASPGRLRLKIFIPQNTPSGITHILTNSSWTCKLNPSTWAVPIRASYDWLLYVKPAADKPK